MKNSIKRAQSRAGSSFAERENFRPKVKQLKKTLLTLVALLAVTTGAWADETPLLTIESKDYASFKSGSMTFDDKVTVTFSNTVKNYGDNWGWYSDLTASLLTVAGINGYTITSCKFYAGDGTADYTVEGESPSVYLTESKVYTDDSKSVNIGSHGVMKIEVYGGVAPAATTVPLTRGTGEKINEWTLTNGMPAGNVTVSVDYFAQAEFAMSTDPTPVALAPAAIADVPANTDDPIVTAGTVANIGQSEVKQGTLMYFVSQSTGNTAPEAPDYDAEGWSEDVPTANGLAQGNAYVWYYIKGAEPANIADRTDDNTRNDSEIMSLGTTGFVTLAPEPTYNVEFAEGTNPEAPADPIWTATPNTDVKKGQTVTVTYTGTRKVIGVKAEKKGAAPAEGKTYTNLQGGEVMHVGDKITETEGKFRYTHHENPQLTDYYTYIFGARTYEVLRADVVYEGSNYKYTESPDGQYYVLKCTYFDYDDLEDWVTEYYFNQNLPVTGTSDGITVTLDGQDGYQRNLYTFWVHEPNP